MVDFVSLAATAQRLVEANGRTVTITKANRTPDNPAEPWRGTSTAPDAGQGGDTQTAIMAFVPPSGGGLGRLVKDLGGQLVSTFDQIGLIAADSLPGIDLEPFTAVLDSDGVVWKIQMRERLQPADVNLLWVLGLKR